MSLKSTNCPGSRTCVKSKIVTLGHEHSQSIRWMSTTLPFCPKKQSKQLHHSSWETFQKPIGRQLPNLHIVVLANVSMASCSLWEATPIRHINAAWQIHFDCWPKLWKGLVIHLGPPPTRAYVSVHASCQSSLRAAIAGCQLEFLLALAREEADQMPNIPHANPDHPGIPPSHLGSGWAGAQSPHTFPPRTHGTQATQPTPPPNSFHPSHSTSPMFPFGSCLALLAPIFPCLAFVHQPLELKCPRVVSSSDH